RIEPDGTARWRSAPLDPNACGGCISDIALLAGHRVAIATLSTDSADLRLLDGMSGAVLWTRHLDGVLVQSPAVAQDHSIRIVNGVTDSAGVTTTIVSSFSAVGELLWQTRLQEDYEQTWEDALVIDPSGAAYVHTFHALISLDAGGQVRWRTEFPTNL